jgi:hypothetical protein
MRTVAIKMKTYARNVHIVDNGNLSERLLNIILFSLGALGLFYTLVLGNMVFNIVERRTLEADARNLSNEVRDLELSYLSVSEKVDLELSHSLGFSEVKATFATRKSTLGSIKPTNNEL